MAQLVEHILGKDEVISSTLITSSRSPVGENPRGFLFCKVKVKREVVVFCPLAKNFFSLYMTLHEPIIMKFFSLKQKNLYSRGSAGFFI